MLFYSPGGLKPLYYVFTTTWAVFKCSVTGHTSSDLQIPVYSSYCLGAKEIFVSVCVLAVYIHLPQLIKVRQDSTGIEVVRDHAASGSQAGPNIRLDEKPGLYSLSGQKPCQSQITLRYAVLQTVK